MSDFQYLTIEDALKLVEMLGAGPVRDAGLLDSAFARPQSSAFGADAYPTLPLKAAAMMHSIVKNYSLFDGNKRMSLLSTHTFVELNNAHLGMTMDEAYNLILEIASGNMELTEVAGRLKIL